MSAGTLLRIVEAGIELFAQNGPSAAGTLEIAEKAGVAECTIFRRFESKDNLVQECIRTSVGRSLDPSHFRDLIHAETADVGHSFASAVQAAVRRWYSSMSVTAARLVLFTSLSSSKRWRNLGTERVNQIIAMLAERIEQEGRRRRTRNLDAKAAATTLITTLLYRKSTSTSTHERNVTTADTCIRQWLLGLFPQATEAGI